MYSKRIFNKIDSLDKLKSFCEIEEITGCWIWPIDYDKKRRSTKGINVHMPDGAIIKTTPRQASWLLSGRKNKKDHFVISKNESCGQNCINPNHLMSIHRCDFNKVQWDRFSSKNPANRISIVKKSQASGNNKLDEEKVKVIRSSSLSEKELAEIYSVHITTISRVKKFKLWKDTLPGASVFNWSGKT